MVTPQKKAQTKPEIPILDFEEIYVPHKRPDLTFVIKPLQKADVDVAARWLSDAFMTHEPTGMILGFTWEDYYVYLKFQAEKAAELQTGLIMYNKDNGEIASVYICEDLYEPSNCEEKSNAVSESYREKMLPFTRFLKQPQNVPEFASNPKARYSCIELTSAAVSKKYQDLGIGQRLTIYAMVEHQYISQATKFIAYSVSAMGNTHASRSGWFLIKDFPYSQWEVNGVKVFKNLEEVQKKHGIPLTSSLQIWGFDKDPQEPKPAL